MRTSRHSHQYHQRPEIRLDRVQIVWLTLGAVVAMGLMFALGMVVGRRAERIAPAPAPESLAHIDQDQAIHQQIKSEEPKPLKFYEELSKTGSEPTKRASAKTVKVKKAKSTASEPAKPVKKDTASAKKREEKKVATSKRSGLADAMARAKSSTGEKKNVRKQLDDGPAKPGEYTVQVSAFQTQAEAEAYAAGLERKGFSPFVVTSSLRGKGVWYRVRMGRFTNEETANKAKGVLARADIPAWVLKAE